MDCEGQAMHELPNEVADLYPTAPAVVSVELRAISADFRAVREGEYDARIEMFTRLFLVSPGDIPPVILVAGLERMLIADGRHRIFAALRAGLRSIPALVVEPLRGMTSQGSARLIGARMSTRAAQPLQLRERKRLAVMFIAEHPDWSDRKVGSESGLDHKTAGKLRKAGNSPPTSVSVDTYGVGPRAEDQAVAAIERFLAKLREAALFDNLKTFKPRVARELARAMTDRFGSNAVRVARTMTDYFTQALSEIEGGNG